MTMGVVGEEEEEEEQEQEERGRMRRHGVSFEFWGGDSVGMVVVTALFLSVSWRRRMLRGACWSGGGQGARCQDESERL